MNKLTIIQNIIIAVVETVSKKQAIFHFLILIGTLELVVIIDPLTILCQMLRHFPKNF